ncbi:MAG: hypothetical protein ABSG28_10360 [Methanoregula sp.]|uniref:hypothetical protein n=1 Tax=Methanoregula sp. TaxID=2052170 RepID=UPI003C1F2A6F
MDKDLKPVEWILPFLFIGSKPDRPVMKDSLRLFEEFFVFVKEVKPELDSHFKFISYSYGPFSHQLKTDLGVLQLLMFIKTRYFNDRTYYYLTEKGRTKARETAAKIELVTIEKIARLRRNPGWRCRGIGEGEYDADY